jgi:hypothetical protein
LRFFEVDHSFRLSPHRLVGEPAIVVSLNIKLIELYCVTVVSNGSVIVALGRIGLAARVEGQKVLGVDLDGLTIISNGVIKFA